jgi:hypothetical protein
MPMKVYCSNCGHVLGEYHDMIEPVEVIRNNYGKCPNCQKSLVFNPDLVRLSPA